MVNRSIEHVKLEGPETLQLVATSRLLRVIPDPKFQLPGVSFNIPDAEIDRLFFVIIRKKRSLSTQDATNYEIIF